jgi:hypothetical protein
MNPQESKMAQLQRQQENRKEALQSGRIRITIERENIPPTPGMPPTPAQLHMWKAQERGRKKVW